MHLTLFDSRCGTANGNGDSRSASHWGCAERPRTAQPLIPSAYAEFLVRLLARRACSSPPAAVADSPAARFKLQLPLAAEDCTESIIYRAPSDGVALVRVFINSAEGKEGLGVSGVDRSVISHHLAASRGGYPRLRCRPRRWSVQLAPH